MKPSPTRYLLSPAWCLLIGWLVALSAHAQDPNTPTQDPDTPPSHQRAAFEQAMRELRSGAGPRYEALREVVADYPLAIYLDYEVLRSDLRRLPPHRAKGFLKEAEGSPLANRFLAAYIARKGRARRWQSLLEVVDSPPRDQRLQCYYYRALRGVGRKEEAWAGARALWNVGASQDDACDPLFDEWMKTGGPDDALVWSRALKAFDARSSHLIKYVKRFASPDLKPLLEDMYQVYRQPTRLLTVQRPATAENAQLITVGVRRLARVNPEKARQALAAADQAFSDQQREAMEAMIVRHSLFAESAAPQPWVRDMLARLADDELTAIYLRNQIRDGHWQHLSEGLDWLSDAERGRDVWRYWDARSRQALGDTEQAESLLTALAGERSYHGFLAADAVGVSYSLNRAPKLAGELPTDLGWLRVRELRATGRNNDANGEWRLLLDRAPFEQQVLLAQEALLRGWPSLAIDAANQAKAWDYLDVRFPSAFEQSFSSAAADHNVPSWELMAIARRESALYPRAQSGVGARGLMQIMPQTGKRVARAIGKPWRRSDLFRPEYNIAIGSHYYRQLLDRFSDHRPMALAGYNAGPNRVVRWSEDGTRTDQWIDSLPFKETRRYVRAVLAYAVIYSQRAGGDARVLTAAETHLAHARKKT